MAIIGDGEICGRERQLQYGLHSSDETLSTSTVNISVLGPKESSFYSLGYVDWILLWFD